jgi:serine/threonine-protein phosphatase Stp1
MSAGARAATRASEWRFASTALSHAGASRTVNEDRVLDRAEAGLWAVADGMGGHRAGDVAASCVIAALAGVERAGSGYAFLSDVLGAIAAANAALYAGQGAGGGASGSTLVALLVHEGHYACLWAGDSRAYLYRQRRLQAITRDHSIVQRLVEEGTLAESERRSHAHAHVITRAIGAKPRVEVEQGFAPVRDGDIFLLCSDGLTGCLEDREIAGILGEAPAVEAADRLLAAALARQPKDNVSLIVIEASGASLGLPNPTSIL